MPKTRWEEFLEEIFEDQSLIEEFRRWVKNLLLENWNDKVLLLVGPGGSGKTTLMATIDSLHGCSAAVATDGAIFRDRKSIHALKDEKLVLVTGSDWLFDKRAITNLKCVLGRDTFCTRGLYEREETLWTPQFSIAIEDNRMRGDLADDFSMQQRVLLVKTKPITSDNQNPALFNQLMDDIEKIREWVLSAE